MNGTAEQTGEVIVTCGANQPAPYNLAGQTIAQAREQLTEVLNIPEKSKALVRGDEVSDDYVLQAGDELEFVKESGTNG